MKAPPDTFDLLLASTDDGPALADGMPAAETQRAPRQVMASHDQRLHGGDPSHLPSQRWGIVAPEGPEGDRMLEAIAPLRKLREREQGAPAMVLRVPAGLCAGDLKAVKRARAARDWKGAHYDGMEENEQPYYLMLLGDMEHTPIELQQVLSNDALVGRVHFTRGDGALDLDGYAAYADKVVRYAEHATPEPAPDLLYYAAADGSRATILGKTKLVDPSVERSLAALAAGRDREPGRIAPARVRLLEAEGVADLLEGAGGARPSVLLTMSHGLGPPRRGFPSPEEQRRRQGALVMRYDEILDAERIEGQSFLPGGVWFFLACFGMGTPTESVYHPWLAELQRAEAFAGSLDAVLQSLAPRGFIAALPQAALRNPNGPLAVIGHIDLAWTYAFTGGEGLTESRASRIGTVLDMLVRGSRAGVALNKLTDDYNKANDTLSASYEALKGDPASIPPATVAHQWMLRNDLRGYVLLGDPATRLPLQSFALQQPSAPAPLEVRASLPEGPASSDTVDGREQAVWAFVRGDEAPQAIAARAGVPLATLWAWVDAYRAGGRARIGG